MLRTILNQKNMSLYQLEKESHISHATLNDIYNERINIDNCSILIMSKIAAALNISIEELYRTLNYEDLSCFVFNEEFDLFKSDILQRLKNMNDDAFVDDVLSNKRIDHYYENKEYSKALYLLSLLDYICSKNSIPIVKEYNSLRDYKLNKISISKSLYLLLLTKRIRITDVYKNCLKPFVKHNILEGQITNVA